MSDHFSKDDLRQGWDALAKDWYSISRWPSVRDVNYTEWIAEWIVDELRDIRLPANWSRAGTFLGSSEQKLDDGLKKQVVQAIGNAYHLHTLGNVISAQFRFRERPVSGFGEVDLLCFKDGVPLIVEVIAPHSRESPLRAVLQAFAHASHVAASPENLLGKEDLYLDEGYRPAPAVLTFAGAESCRQLENRREWPKLFELVGILNEDLRSLKIFDMEFYVVQNERIEDHLHIDGQRVFFKPGFKPNIAKC
jgi:hypothetical protein